ncbi:MAG: tetratricopeptide repeat protein [Cyclobacteriaceae bacterium]|nr:tetratricopeptide repeat protein [Cyclobacteriaceae bacterium]
MTILSSIRTGLVNPYVWINLLILLLLVGCKKQKDSANAEVYDSSIFLLKDTLLVKEHIQDALHHIRKLGEETTDMDSAALALSYADTLSTRIKYARGSAEVLLARAELARELRQNDVSKRAVEEARQIGEKEQDFVVLGKCALHDALMLSAYSTPEELDKKIKINLNALEYFEKSGAKHQQADILKDLGDLYQIQYKYDVALATLQRSVRLYEEIGYPRTHSVYELLGAVSAMLNDYEGALQYGLKAVSVAESLQDTSFQMCSIYNRLAITYGRLNQWDKATDAFNKSLAVAMHYRDNGSVYILVRNLCNAFIRNNRPQEGIAMLNETASQLPPESDLSKIFLASGHLMLRTKLKDYTGARKAAFRILEFQQDDWQTKMAWPGAYLALARYFLETKEFAQADHFLSRALEIGKNVKETEYLRNIHQLGFKIDSAQGKYIAAIEHFRMYKTLGDSLLSESKNKTISRLQVEFETEKKNRDIELKEKNIDLLTKQGLLRDAELMQSNLIRNATLVGGGVLLLLIGLLYRNHKARLGYTKDVESKNVQLRELIDEREWLLKEIHHRVKNNLQIIMSLLNTQSAYVDNPNALEAIRNSQHRMFAMSLIHQKLYQAENISSVNMPSYIMDFIQYLQSSMGTVAEKVRFKHTIDNIELTVAQSVPIGLILNEAVTNCMKYAFPDQRSRGNVEVEMIQRAERVCLTIRDDGVGLPDTFDIRATTSLGMSLIKGLSKQLEADLSIVGDTGTTISLSFIKTQTVTEIHGIEQTVLN